MKSQSEYTSTAVHVPNSPTSSPSSPCPTGQDCLTCCLSSLVIHPCQPTNPTMPQTPCTFPWFLLNPLSILRLRRTTKLHCKARPAIRDRAPTLPTCVGDTPGAGSRSLDVAAAAKMSPALQHRRGSWNVMMARVSLHGIPGRMSLDKPHTARAKRK